MRHLLLVSTLVFGANAHALGQSETLQPGQQVRVTADSPHMLVGLTASFQAVQGDTLVVFSDSVVKCSLKDVTRLEVLRRESLGPVRGAVLGGLLGFSLGMPVGGAVGTVTKADYVIESAAYGGLIGLSVGLVAGGVWGGLSGSNHWEEVPVDRLRVSIARTRDGVVIGARIVF